MTDALSRRRLSLLLTASVMVLATLPRLVSSLKSSDPAPLALRPGLVLVARPGKVDRNFDATVVLLVETGGERTWGLVLNRVKTPGGEPLPLGVDRWGGPVRREQPLTLLRETGSPLPGLLLIDGLRWTEGLATEGLPHGTALTFDGMSAWSPEQLASEIAGGAWWVMEGQADTAFLAPGALWAEHAARHL